MSDVSRLVRAMRQAGATPENENVDLVYGTVKSINPLSVTVNKLTLTSEFLIASPFCWDSSIPSSGDDDCRVGRALKTGDKVLMLKCGKGQKYYLLHRVN